MNNPASSLVSSASSPKPPGIEALMTASGTESVSSDAQAFARWMAQHREAQVPVAGLNALPDAQVARTAPQPTPVPGWTTSAQAGAARANLRPPAATVAPDASAADAPAEPDRPATSARSTAPKSAQKPSQPPKEVTRSRAPDAETTPEAAGPREVGFKTAQGEATAWVQELQPPPELSTSDPAAMMAWLASLTQTDASPAAAFEGSLNPGVADPGAAARSDLTAGGLTSRSGHEALADAASAAMQQAQLEAAAMESVEGQVAEAVQGASTEAPVALDFGALMARESLRAAADRTGVEAPRHYTGSLGAPVDSPDFAQALADRVGLWVSGPALNGPMTAELRLNPAEMGPVQIRIELDGNQAQIDFVAAQPETRQAIESSLSLLSGALEDAGLELAGGGVSDQSAGRQAFQSGDGASTGQGNPWRSAQSEPGGERMTVDAGALVPAGTPGRAGGLGNGLDLYA